MLLGEHIGETEVACWMERSDGKEEEVTSQASGKKGGGEGGGRQGGTCTSHAMDLCVFTP